MAHAKAEHLDQIPTLLAEIRKNLPLKEKSTGCFYLKSKGVLHFHIKGERFYAHAFDGRSWNEIDVDLPVTSTKQKTLAKSLLAIVQSDH